MVKFNKSYLYILSYIVCIFPIITLIFSVIYTNTPYLTGILTELRQSLDDFPLSDLEYTNNCSEAKYSTILYKVPGSYEGCSCVNVSDYPYKQANKHIVFKGRCKKNHTLNGCISVNAFPRVDLRKWHSNEFCSKKYLNNEGYKKYFTDSVGEDENCPNGYKKCGKLDDMGNYLCLPQGESCPINDIQTSNLKNDSLIEKGYEEYEIGDKYLYFTNKSENPLITKLKIAEEKLCAGKGYYYTSYPQFILDENFGLYGCRYKISGSLYDDTVSKLDIMTKNELFTNNNFSMYSRYNNSCEYPYFSLNAEMFLYPKRYIGFNKKCLKQNHIDIGNKIFQSDHIDSINNNLLKNRKQHSILIWISIAAIDFYLMTCFFIDIDKDNNLTNFYIWCIITIPFYLAMNIVAIIGLAAMSHINKYPLCNNETTNNKIKLFNGKSRNMLLNTLALVIIINGQLLLTIILFFLKRRKILRNNNNINQTDSQIINSVNDFNQDMPFITTQSSESN